MYKMYKIGSFLTALLLTWLTQSLVSHHIRYGEDYIKNRNVDYVKLTVKGGGVVPTDDEFDAFVTVIKQFQLPYRTNLDF